MRSLLLAATATLAVGLLPGSLVAPTPAVAGVTCGGLAVTIDLDQPDHPDPDRAASDVILGTDGDDQIDGGRGADVICGGAGNDSIEGGRGSDVIDGEDGDDNLEWGLGFAGEDVVGGGPGDDAILGAGQGDRYYGGPGADTMFGQDCQDYGECGPGVVRMFGGPGHDWFRPSLNRDLVDGGGGTDLVDYNDAAGPYGSRIGVTIDLAITGPQDPGPGRPDTIREIEDLGGSSGKDRLYGNDGPNSIDGSGDQDALFGRGGDDTLDGAGGIDWCRGGPGVDEFVSCDPAIQ